MLSFLYFNSQEEEYIRNDQNDILNTYMIYTDIFAKLKIFDLSDSDKLLSENCLIDINTLDRLYFPFDIDRKIKRGFPTVSKNVVIYVGDAHLHTLMYYLTNFNKIPFEYMKKDNNTNTISVINSQLVTDYAYMHNRNYLNDDDFCLPSIFENIDL